MQKGKFTEALKELEKAEEDAQQAKAGDIFLSLQTIKGQLMQTLGEHEEALKIYSFAIKTAEDLLSKDPDNEYYQSSLQMNFDAIFTLGNLSHSMGLFLEAKDFYELNISIFQKVLTTDPENALYQLYTGTALNNLGNLFFDMGQPEKAKQKYAGGIL